MSDCFVQTPHELARTLGILTDGLRESWRNSEDMERLSKSPLSFCVQGRADVKRAQKRGIRYSRRHVEEQESTD
jgi:hypothetical protein